VSNHTGGVLGDQRQLWNELFRRPNALDERRDLVGVSDECRADHLCDHGMVRVALGTDDDALGHGDDGSRARWLSRSCCLGLLCVLPARRGDSTTRTDARYTEVIG